MTEQDFVYCLTVVVAAFFSAAWIACSYFGRLRAQLHCKDAMIEGLQAQRANLIQKLAKQEDSRHNEEYWPRLTDPKGTLPAGVLEGLQFLVDEHREELSDIVVKEMVADATKPLDGSIYALIKEQVAAMEKDLIEQMGRDIFGEPEEVENDATNKEKRMEPRIVIPTSYLKMMSQGHLYPGDEIDEEPEEVEDNLIDDAAKAALDLYQRTIVDADEYKRITGQAWTYTKDLPQQGCPNSRPLYAPRV